MCILIHTHIYVIFTVQKTAKGKGTQKIEKNVCKNFILIGDYTWNIKEINSVIIDKQDGQRIWIYIFSRDDQQPLSTIKYSTLAFIKEIQSRITQ